MTDSTADSTGTTEDTTAAVPEDRTEERAAAAEKVKPHQTEADEARAFDVEEYMRDVIDPELGINVVDLGLVYDIWIENGDEAVIEMTLTSPACPLTDVLEDQAEQAVVGNKVASKLTIKWVWMPPWTPAMITEDGREQLRALGFSV